MARKSVDRVYKVSTPNKFGDVYSWVVAGFISARTAEMALLEAKDSFEDGALAVEPASESEIKEFLS